ncbi:MAG: glycosyltransferase [Candidatus Limnocylindrales bacterium]
MTPLRVAYLPPSLSPAGAERQMLALAEGLPRDRFCVDFLAMSGRGPYDERALAAGAGLRYIGSLPRVGASKLERMVGRGFKAVRYAYFARAGHYDVVDAWLYPVDVMAVLGRSITRTPVVVTGRYNLRDFNRPMTALEQRINALANRRVDAVVANSDAVAADALRHETIDPAKLRVIRNGVEPIEPLTPVEVESRRRALGVANDELLVGCVANYQPVKRHDLLIEAFASLRREGHKLRLLMVGEGPLRGELQRQIDAYGLQDCARLHGRVTDPKPLLSLFDLVVQTSRSEGLPNALLEAAAAARPIVATAAGGSGEIVIDGDTGLLVPVNDVDGITAAMRRMVMDRDLRGRLGLAARRRADTTFRMSRFIGEYAALYEELAEAKGLLPGTSRPSR